MLLCYWKKKMSIVWTVLIFGPSKQNELASRVQEISEKLEEAQKLVFTERQKSLVTVQDKYFDC